MSLTVRLSQILHHNDYLCRHWIMNLQNSPFFQVASLWNFVLQYHKTAYLFPTKKKLKKNAYWWKRKIKQYS